jgi:hypothetical protein
LPAAQGGAVGRPKGKSGEAQGECADRVAFFLDTFSWSRKKKDLARQGKKNKKRFISTK